MPLKPIHRQIGSRESWRANELGEDLKVAIEEFLERHPDTSPSEICEAMRIAVEQAGAWRARRRWILLLVALAVAVTAVVAGLVLALGS